jgi:hypothetical protein
MGSIPPLCFSRTLQGVCFRYFLMPNLTTFSKLWMTASHPNDIERMCIASASCAPRQKQDFVENAEETNVESKLDAMQGEQRKRLHRAEQIEDQIL